MEGEKVGVSKGQFRAIKAAITPTEREIVKYYEIEWALRHRVPTSDEVVEQVNRVYANKGYAYRLDFNALAYHMRRACVRKALSDRGIKWEQHSQADLTQAQVACAMVMMNFADTRSNDQKLSELGITSAQYYAWLDDPKFKMLIDRLKDKNLEHIDTVAVSELTKKINKGEWNAIKWYMETTGTLRSNEAPQTEQLLRVFIEIIQKHVKEPDVIMAIANDLKMASANRTLEYVAPNTTIDSYTVDDEDEELEKAKRMIGF